MSIKFSIQILTPIFLFGNCAANSIGKVDINDPNYRHSVNIGPNF